MLRAIYLHFHDTFKNLHLFGSAGRHISKDNSNLNSHHGYTLRMPWKDISKLLILTYFLTYLFASWSRVLQEKLTDLQLVKKFPAFYGTRSFIIAVTSIRHLSLS
jgi:hypothetical protein